MKPTKNIFACGTLIAALCSCSQIYGAGDKIENIAENIVSPNDTAGSSAAHSIFQPSTPSEVTWCGETVKIDNEYFRERFDREIMNYSYSYSSVMQTLKRAHRYFPQIEQALKEEGMPTDLKYLAAVESSLNPRAYSPAKAAGMWQMVPAAAQENGLEVNNDIDQRYDIAEETKAACRYLRRSYEVLGRWCLSAASYNTGRGRVAKQKKVQMADDFYQMNLLEETNRYVFRILALKTLMENPAQYGYKLKEQDLYNEVPCKTVAVDTTINDLALFARQQGINFNLLKEENPWLRSNKLPNNSGKKYLIRIPQLNSQATRPYQGQATQETDTVTSSPSN